MISQNSFYQTQNQKINTMEHLKLFSAAFLCGLILTACSGTAANKTNTPTNSDPAGTSGGSGKDMFYEYNLTASSKEMSIQSDTKMYISSKGDMRVEMNMTNSFKGNKSSTPIVTIGHSDKPNESISIDDLARTYSYNHFSDSDFVTGEKIKTLSVTKVGEEKILGYNSVHARIITEKSIGGFYSDIDTIDLSRSDDVPFLTSVKNLFQKFESKTGNSMYSQDVVGQLKQMGCDGFMTKMEIHSKKSSTTEVLVKAEHRDLPLSMFQIPAGYKEDKEGL